MSRAGQAVCSAAIPATPSCYINGVRENNPYLLDDGHIFARFSVTLDPVAAVQGKWSSQVVGAYWNTPSKKFGPSDGPVATGANTSLVTFPNPTDVPPVLPLMFDVRYDGGLQDILAWNSPTCRLHMGPESWSITVAAPAITTVSPSSGALGSQVAVTITGVSLDATTSVNVTAANGQSAPAVLNFERQDEATVTATLDLSAPNITPGVYSISVTSFGATTNALSFTVGDTTPVIDSVDQPTELDSGGQGPIVINGSNFGPGCNGLPCTGARLDISCNSSSGQCNAQSTLTYSVSTWSPNQVTAQVSAPAGAMGFYDVRIVSAGSTGQGFQSTPGAPVTQTSNSETIVVTQLSNLKLSVNWAPVGQTSFTAVSPGQCSAAGTPKIDAVPQMPQINAKLTDASGNPVTGLVSWQIIVKSRYKDRVGGITIPSLAVMSTPSPQPLQGADQTWSAIFPSVLGGTGAVQWQYWSPGQPPPASATAWGKFSFSICGTNPDFSAVDAALGQTSPKGFGYWFARNIAIHETNESQFCEPLRLQSGGCSNSTTFGLPTFGFPAGYGLGQLDPVDSTDQLWNWRSNAAGTIKRLDGRQGYGQWISAVTQWNARNLQLKQVGQPTTPAPPDVVETSSCTFTLPLDQYGAGLTTSATGQPNTYWFGDALVMKQTGGGPRYVALDPVTNMWSFNKVSTIQWNTNSGTIVEYHNFAYEFCTCTTAGVPPASGCQHQTPADKLR